MLNGKIHYVDLAIFNSYVTNYQRDPEGNNVTSKWKEPTYPQTTIFFSGNTVYKWLHILKKMCFCREGFGAPHFWETSPAAQQSQPQYEFSVQPPTLWESSSAMETSDMHKHATAWPITVGWFYHILPSKEVGCSHCSLCSRQDGLGICVHQKGNGLAMVSGWLGMFRG